MFWRFVKPTERLVLFFSLLTTLLYLCSDVSARDAINFYLSQVWTVLYIYPLALLVSFVFVFSREGYRSKKAGKPSSEQEAWLVYRRSYLNLSSVAYDLRLINAVMVMFVLFLHLKNLIIHINPRIYDQSLLELEKAVLGGRLAFEVLHEIIGVEHASLVSDFYQWFYPYLSILVLILVMQRNRNLAERFCSCFCLTWFLGVLVVYLYPTLGPCFYVPDIYASLPHTHMTDMQADLWSMRMELLNNPLHPSAVYSISGLPSLHLAVVLLGTYYLFMVSRLAGMLSIIFLLLTVLSTLYFGWHYIWDDLASFILVFICLWFIEGWYLRSSCSKKISAQ